MIRNQVFRTCKLAKSIIIITTLITVIFEHSLGIVVIIILLSILEDMPKMCKAIQPIKTHEV